MVSVLVGTTIIVPQILKPVSLCILQFSVKRLPRNKHSSPLLRARADNYGNLRNFIRKEKSKSGPAISLHCFWRNIEMSKMICKDWKMSCRLKPLLKLTAIVILPQLFIHTDFLVSARIGFDIWKAEDCLHFWTREPPPLPLLRPFLSGSCGKASTSSFLGPSFWVHSRAPKTQFHSSLSLKRSFESGNAA